MDNQDKDNSPKANKKNNEKEGTKIARTAKEIQKVQIEHLMNRIDKPIVLPENKGVVLKPPKDFIRNIQGILINIYYIYYNNNNIIVIII